MIVTQRRDLLQFTVTSSNTAVATAVIDPNRPNFLQITGVSTGVTTITVTATGPTGSVQLSCQVNVT